MSDSIKNAEQHMRDLTHDIPGPQEAAGRVILQADHSHSYELTACCGSFIYLVPFPNGDRMEVATDCVCDRALSPSEGDGPCNQATNSKQLKDTVNRMRQMWDRKLTGMADSVYMGMTSLVAAVEHQDQMARDTIAHKQGAMTALQKKNPAKSVRNVRHGNQLSVSVAAHPEVNPGLVGKIVPQAPAANVTARPPLTYGRVVKLFFLYSLYYRVVLYIIGLIVQA
ncbi:hypothetical protein EJ07DRAFT_184884 [Lizonia empirigonia]|nr:hypothetical protein EJ07DRAFT_184884 [Lizonia empirigonia]